MEKHAWKYPWKTGKSNGTVHFATKYSQKSSFIVIAYRYLVNNHLIPLGVINGSNDPLGVIKGR